MLAGQVQKPKLTLTCGYGIYDAYFVGLGTNIGPKNQIYLTSGSDFSFTDHKQFSLAISEIRKLFTVYKIKINFGIKLLYWRLEDRYFIFSSAALQPFFATTIDLKKKLSIFTSIGPLFNMQLKSIRKNYEAIGWPKKIGANWSLGLRYNFF